MKKIFTVAIVIAALLLSSCANREDNAVTSETEGTVSLSQTTQSEAVTSASETEKEIAETTSSTETQTQTTTTAAETAESIAESPAEAVLTGKWTEKNRLYTYEFDDSGNVTIDTLSCKISGRYELNGEYDLILYLDCQTEEAGEGPLIYGFDLKKTDTGYEMNYHCMDDLCSMPFEPMTAVTGLCSALWDDEPFVLTAYIETPIIQQNDVLGLWDFLDNGMILLFTEDQVYSADEDGIVPLDDTIIKDGTWEIDGETAYLSTDGEKVVMSTLFGTYIMTRRESEKSPLTGVFIVEEGEEQTEIWLKNGKGIVNGDPSSAAASVKFDGDNIIIKIGDKTISGAFCPCELGSYYSDHDKFGYYKDGVMPCNYAVLSGDSGAYLRFDYFTLYNSKFNDWYTKQK